MLNENFQRTTSFTHCHGHLGCRSCRNLRLCLGHARRAVFDAASEYSNKRASGKDHANTTTEAAPKSSSFSNELCRIVTVTMPAATKDPIFTICARATSAIHQLITGGVKGEVPSFGRKLNDSDVRALTAYLRTLRS